MKRRARPRAHAPAVRSDLPEDILAFIEECRLSAHPDSYLIAVLQKIQMRYGYLSRERLDAVSQLMQIPSARVSGVANFYHFFTFVPKGRHVVTVCLGTACYVKGAGQVLARFEELLGIRAGQTTPDRLFSLAGARCLGACALAPVVVVDDKVFGNVTVSEAPRILAQFGFDSKAK
jgi:NADH:ubiquinone oxidoreductase subunit E